MASIGTDAVCRDVENAASEDDVKKRIDQYRADLKQQAKAYGWPPEVVAKRVEVLRVKLRTTGKLRGSLDVTRNCQTALDRLDE